MSNTAAESCAELISSMRSLQLCTVGDDGWPHCGYTPFIFEQPCSLYVFVSQLSAHTRDLQAHGRAAVMIIRDENQATQVFARERVSYQCYCERIEPTSPEYTRVLDIYEVRQGKMAGLLRQLPDFLLFHLQPQSGQFVMGFGKAFRLVGESLREFKHTRTG